MTMNLKKRLRHNHVEEEVGNWARSESLPLDATYAEVTSLPLRFDCNSTALRPFDDLRYDRVGTAA